MPAEPHRHHFSPEEYLAFERASHERHEYLNGEVLAMAGASAQHSLIVINLAREVSLQLKGRPCTAFANDLRVRVETGSLYAYPDLVAVCGEPRFADREHDTLLNPTLLIEVLSPSTEGYDRGTKAALYRRIDFLQEYLLIAQDRPHVEVFRRLPDDQWVLLEAKGLDATIELPSIGCSLALAEVYDKVEF
jgi:Uma2 family endonuclease